MFNCFKNTKKIKEKKRRESIRNKKLSNKFFIIVVTGVEEYEKQQQKEVAIRRWSHLQKRINSINAFKKKYKIEIKNNILFN